MSPELSEFVRLAPLGLIVGAFGTVVGAGGGAVMVPVLLVLLPQEAPATMTYQGKYGKQYVAVSAAGGGAITDPNPSNNESLYVFALP